MMQIRNREDAIKLIRGFKKESGEGAIRLGLAGSFSRDTPNPDSDIDIVIEYDTAGDDVVVFSKRLKAYVEAKTDRKYDIVWLNRLKEQEEEQQKLMLTLGIVDRHSVYQNILKDVIWVE